MTDENIRKPEEKKEFKRQCPKCGKDIFYKNKYRCVYAERDNKSCASCSRYINREYEKLEKNDQGKFTRQCPQCNKELLYKYQNECRNAERDGSVCVQCAGKNKRGRKKPLVKQKQFVRICPECGVNILHTQKDNCNLADKNKKPCAKCAGKKRRGIPRSEEVRESLSLSKKKFYQTEEGKENIRKRAEILSKKYQGSGNPFWGKTHSEESISKMIESCGNYEHCKTDDFRKKQSVAHLGRKNPNAGKSLYEVWVRNHGEEEANRRLEEYREKQSKNFSGENNPMYGKPSPKGSGCGWSGWYKGWYFRSLMEVSYVINVLERDKLEWKSAEYISILYVDSNDNYRTYHPDFIVENKKIVEVKPKYKWEDDDVWFKQWVGELYCKERGMKYEVVSIPSISYEKVIELVDKGEMVLLDKWAKRLESVREKLEKKKVS